MLVLRHLLFVHFSFINFLFVKYIGSFLRKRILSCAVLILGVLSLRKTNTELMTYSKIPYKY